MQPRVALLRSRDAEVARHVGGCGRRPLRSDGPSCLPAARNADGRAFDLDRLGSPGNRARYRERHAGQCNMTNRTTIPLPASLRILEFRLAGFMRPGRNPSGQAELPRLGGSQGPENRAAAVQAPLCDSAPRLPTGGGSPTTSEGREWRVGSMTLGRGDARAG